MTTTKTDTIDALRAYLTDKADEYADVAFPGAVLPYLALLEAHLRFPRSHQWGSSSIIQRLRDLDEFKPGETTERYVQQIAKFHPDASTADSLTRIYNGLVADAKNHDKEND